MFRKYLVVGIIILVAASNSLLVVRVENKSVEGGVYEVSMRNPKTSSRTQWIYAVCTIVSGTLNKDGDFARYNGEVYVVMHGVECSNNWNQLDL